MDIKLGDRITFEDGDEVIAYTCDDIETIEGCGLKVIKIERPKWEVVEEKKELLTEEEREFLKFFIKHYKVGKIRFHEEYIDITSTINTCVTCPDYPENMKFEGVERWKDYTLKELGLEE